MSEDLKFIELPKPTGDFILKNLTKGISRADGEYYHYADICVLLKKFEEKLRKEQVERDATDIMNVIEGIGLSIDDQYETYSDAMDAIVEYLEVNG